MLESHHNTDNKRRSLSSSSTFGSMPILIPLQSSGIGGGSGVGNSGRVGVNGHLDDDTILIGDGGVGGGIGAGGGGGGGGSLNRLIPTGSTDSGHVSSLSSSGVSDAPLWLRYGPGPPTTFTPSFLNHPLSNNNIVSGGGGPGMACSANASPIFSPISAWPPPTPLLMTNNSPSGFQPNHHQFHHHLQLQQQQQHYPSFLCTSLPIEHPRRMEFGSSPLGIFSSNSGSSGIIGSGIGGGGGGGSGSNGSYGSAFRRPTSISLVNDHQQQQLQQQSVAIKRDCGGQAPAHEIGLLQQRPNKVLVIQTEDAEEHFINSLRLTDQHRPSSDEGIRRNLRFSHEIEDSVEQHFQNSLKMSGCDSPNMITTIMSNFTTTDSSNNDVQLKRKKTLSECARLPTAMQHQHQQQQHQQQQQHLHHKDELGFLRKPKQSWSMRYQQDVNGQKTFDCESHSIIKVHLNGSSQTPP